MIGAERQLAGEPGQEVFGCLVDPVQILHQHHQRPARRLRHQQPRSAPNVRSRMACGSRSASAGSRVCHAERVPQVVRQRHVELESLDPQLDLDRTRSAASSAMIPQALRTSPNSGRYGMLAP